MPHSESNVGREGENLGSVSASNKDGARLAGNSTQVSKTTREVVQLEGSAKAESPADLSSVARAYLFEGDEVRQIAITELPKYVADEIETLVWVDLSEYSEHDLQGLSEMIDLHPSSINNTLSSWQHPRLDVYGDYYFATATLPVDEPENYRVSASELDLFVDRTYLISAHRRPLPFFEEVKDRAWQSPKLILQDTAFLLYIVLDALLEHYEGLTERVEDQVERMEERALKETSDELLGEVLKLKRYTFALRRLVEQHRVILRAFLRPDFPFTAREEMEHYFRDLEERLQRLLAALSSAEGAVKGAFEIFISHVSHRTNQVVRTLTIVSVLFLPPTLLVGFFGTNFVSSDPFLYRSVAFYVMMVAIVLTSIGSLFIFRRKGWL